MQKSWDCVESLLRVHNHDLSRFRVRVKHSIAKLKSFRMLSERYR